MGKLAGNERLTDARGNPLFSLRDVNGLEEREKERIYSRLLPRRLLEMFGISRETLCAPDGRRRVRLIAPQGLGLVRIEVREIPGGGDPAFFLDAADTHFRQMELAFCIISDPSAPRFNVDVDSDGRNNLFATQGRNIPEEIRAMRAGLFPNQTRRGLGMFSEFFALFERFVDALAMEMIVAEPLTYDNAIRYEKYGFDYITGRRLMREINEGFRPGGPLYEKLDGSTPFRAPGMERTVRGRSWAIHDGILDVPWDGVRIYKIVGEDAGVDTFPEREKEEVRP